MTVTSRLTSVEELRTLLRLPSLEADDPYALMILAQASNRVREAAKQPGWVVWDGDGLPPTEPGAGQTWAPETAKEITLWVAYRAFTNPKNLERRTSGPISETFRNGVGGLELTADEEKRLNALTGSSTNGLWSLPMTGGQQEERMLTVPVIMYDGKTFPGARGFHIADNGDWPYGYEP